jgi:hypothetical protein
MQFANTLGSGRGKLLGALMLGVAAGAIATLAERVDAALTGGNYTPFGYVNTYMWVLVSAVLFGLLGAVVTTEIQAVLGLVTFANPLSWLWPIINPMFAMAAGLTSMALTRLNSGVRLGVRIVLMSFALAILDIPMVYVVVVLVLGLPFPVYLISLPIYVALQLAPTTLLSYFVVRAINRSGILGRIGGGGFP